MGIFIFPVFDALEALKTKRALKKAVKEGGVYSVDLKKLGFQKLLGTGKTGIKLKITVPSCSPRAEEKIKSAGGEVSVEKTTTE